MASTSSLFKTAQKIVLTEKAIQACHRVQRDVFAHLPQLNMRTGHQMAKMQFTGEYIAPERYFHATIDPVARKFYPGYTTELEERRQLKVARDRRMGKGPPKKGQGKRQQKKQNRAVKKA